MKFRNMTILFLAIAGSILTGVAATVQYLDKVEASRKAEKAKLELEKNNKELKEANEKILTLTETIVEETNNLLKANVKITELQNLSLNEMTGGTNLPAISVGINGNAVRDFDPITRTHMDEMRHNYNVEFTLGNAGKYTLKDVMFSIKDVYNKPINSQITPYNYETQRFTSDEIGSYHNIEVKNLAIKSKKIVYKTKLPENNGTAQYEFDIILEWSNGLYQTHVIIDIKNGNIDIKTIFYDSDGNKIDEKTLIDRINK